MRTRQDIIQQKYKFRELLFFTASIFVQCLKKHKNKYSYVIRNPVSFVMKNGLKHLQVFFAAVSLEYEPWTVI